MLVSSSTTKQKISVFRVTRPYLNLLVKPRFFSGFLEKCIIIFFSRKKMILNKCVCLPYLKFSNPLPETHLFFIWPNMVLCRLCCYSRDNILEKKNDCEADKKQVKLASKLRA